MSAIETGLRARKSCVCVYYPRLNVYGLLHFASRTKSEAAAQQIEQTNFSGKLSESASFGTDGRGEGLFPSKTRVRPKS